VRLSQIKCLNALRCNGTNTTYTETFASLIYCVIDRAWLQATPDILCCSSSTSLTLSTRRAAAAFLPKFCSQPGSDLKCSGAPVWLNERGRFPFQKAACSCGRCAGAPSWNIKNFPEISCTTGSSYSVTDSQQHVTAHISLYLGNDARSLSCIISEIKRDVCRDGRRRKPHPSFRMVPV